MKMALITGTHVFCYSLPIFPVVSMKYSKIGIMRKCRYNLLPEQPYSGHLS